MPKHSIIIYYNNFSSHVEIWHNTFLHVRLLPHQRLCCGVYFLFFCSSTTWGDVPILASPRPASPFGAVPLSHNYTYMVMWFEKAQNWRKLKILQRGKGEGVKPDSLDKWDLKEAHCLILKCLTRRPVKSHIWSYFNFMLFFLNFCSTRHVYFFMWL